LSKNSIFLYPQESSVKVLGAFNSVNQTYSQPLCAQPEN